MWNTKVCLSTLRRKLEKAVKNIIFLTLSVNSVTFSVCWVPLVRFCSEGFWVISENCEYSEQDHFYPPLADPVFPFILKHPYWMSVLAFLRILLVCSSKLHPEGRFSATYVWPALSSTSLGGKKCRICTLSFPLLKFLLVMQLNMLLREEKHLILSILRAKVL